MTWKNFFNWTFDALNPAWRDENQAKSFDHFFVNHYRWLDTLGKLLAKIALQLPLETTESKFLEPIFKQPDNISQLLLKPFKELFVSSKFINPLILTKDTSALKLLKVLFPTLFKKTVATEGKH